MDPSQQPISSGVFALVILVLAPFVGTLINSIYDLLGTSEISPVLPKLVSYSFAQAFFAISLALAFPVQQGFQIAALSTFVFLLIVVGLQATIDKIARDRTQEHVRQVLGTKSHLKPDVNYELVRDIAYSMVDVDFMPKSPPNLLSGSPRKVRREHLINLINKYLSQDETTKLVEEDFLLPPDTRRNLKAAYMAVSIFAIGLYILSCFLSISLGS